MHYFQMTILTDEHPNSHWDALWPEDDDPDAMDPLCLQKALSPDWRPMKVTIQKRKKKPDIYMFDLSFAVNQKAKDVLSEHLGSQAEFLPLESSTDDCFYGLHILKWCRATAKSKLKTSEVSGNIIDITRLSIAKTRINNNVLLFQVGL